MLNSTSRKERVRQNSIFHPLSHYFPILFWNFSLAYHKKVVTLPTEQGKMPEWSIGPHSKCGVRATVPGVRIPLSPQTTGWSAGLQTFVCNLFYFRGGQIYPERSEDKSWSYGWQAKIRSSQGRLRSNGGKDGRHAVTRSRAGSAEEWKRGEMLYGSTAFLCLQRGKVVRISYGVCIEREAVKGLASFLSSENRIFGNDF